MLDKESIQAIANKQLSWNAALYKELTLNGASITIWRSVRSLPAKSIAIAESLDGELFIPSQSISQFELMLKEIQPSLVDESSILAAFRLAAPSRRIPSTNKIDVLPKYQNLWKPVKSEPSVLEFYCENRLEGKFERITIDGEYNVSVTTIGPGRKSKLR